MKIRLIAFMLVLLIAATLLIACGDEPADTTTGEVTTAASTTAATTAADPFRTEPSAGTNAPIVPSTPADEWSDPMQ